LRLPMPSIAPKPCSVCRRLVVDGTSRCDEHKVKAGAFADRSRGTRHERGYGAQWGKLRAMVMRRDGGICRCAQCQQTGAVVRADEVDHRVPKHLGGTDDPANLQAISRACHRAKTAREAAAARGVGLPATATDGGGGRIFAGYRQGTDLKAGFSRAGVSEGGVVQ